MKKESIHHLRDCEQIGIKKRKTEVWSKEWTELVVKSTEKLEQKTIN